MENLINSYYLEEALLRKTLTHDVTEKGTLNKSQENEAKLMYVLTALVGALSGTKETATKSVSESSSDYDFSSGNVPSWFNGDVDTNDYLSAVKELEKMLKWQAANFTNISGMYDLLQYMVNFAEAYPDSSLLSMDEYKDTMLTLMKNLVAEAFVVSGGDKTSTKSAIETLENLVSGLPSALSGDDGVLNDFESNYGNYNYYAENYEDSNGNVISTTEFELKAGADMASLSISTTDDDTGTTTNDINDLINQAYKEEINALCTKYADNPWMLFLSLMAIIMQKENDSEYDITGEANMLDLLGKGEDVTGDLTNALASIVNDYNDDNSGSTISDDDVQTFANAFCTIYSMGYYLGGDDSVLSGLQDNVDQLFDDFTSTTGVSLDQLEGAAEGNSDDISDVKNGLINIMPETTVSSDDTSTTSDNDFQTVNNDINNITTYFNDHNSTEQAEAQYLSSMDEEFLSFIKSALKAPNTFETAIIQNQKV